MIHAETILRALDSHLASPTDLILYGRAALALGFQPPLAEATLSLDVDAILPAAQSAHLDSDAAFWDALEATNHSLEPAGLYLTHLFEESQVILRPTWLEHLVPIPMPALRHLHIFRPHALDLLLTKMMRGLDPQDMADAAFLIHSATLDAAAIRTAMAQARIPDVPEIHAAFRAAQPHVLHLAKNGP